MLKHNHQFAKPEVFDASYSHQHAITVISAL